MSQTGRRPLLIKGARQVGKTWLVREFAKTFDTFVELNFEREPALGSLFERQRDPRRLVQEIAAFARTPITPGKTLLFFDEVQQSLAAIRSIRYFYEELPALHLVAAGSLLNTVLEKVPTGVGRVSYLHLYPLCISEFLDAAGESILLERVRAQDPVEALPTVHHERLLDLVRMYMLLGGMPGVLAQYFRDGDILACERIQSDLLESFVDDFHKYAKEADIHHLAAVFRSVPLQLGQKFKYVTVDPAVRSRVFARALSLLEMAGIVHKVYQTAADGIPLAARIRSSRFKVLFFDVGLAQRLLAVDLAQWMTNVDISSVNRGAIAEQLVGQELAALFDAGPLAPLTYWHRETRGSSAEVDYVLELDRSIVPIEVKEGTQGGMKSLHLFLKEKKQPRGVKISKYGFSDDGTVATVPFYAIERLAAGR
jgi:predicted AAA+ superfamily ATPase